MQFKIPCETYVRLAHATGKEEPLNCIRIEDSYAVATDRRIMSIQCLDESYDGSVNVVIDAALISVCEFESNLNSDLIIDTMDGVPWAVAKTSGGYVHPGNGAIFPPDGSIWNEWRSVVPDVLSQQASGFIFMDTDLLTRLGQSSPSRQFIFPKVIDTRMPVIVRDWIDPSWFGMFLPTNKKDQNMKAATYPEWFK